MNILNLPDDILQQLFKERPVINKELQILFNDNVPSIYNSFIKEEATDIVLYSIKCDDETDINKILNKYYKKDHWTNQYYYGLINEKYLKTFLYKKCHIEKIDVITKSICDYIQNDFYVNYKLIYNDLCNYELKFYQESVIRKYYDENCDRFKNLTRGEFLRYFKQYIKMNIFKIENEDDYEEKYDYEKDISKIIYIYGYTKYFKQIKLFRENIFKNTNIDGTLTKTRKIIYKHNPNVYYKSNTEIKNELQNI
jgi:hypothetical protein